MGQLGQPDLQLSIDIYSKLDWLVVSTRLKNNSQIGSFLQVGVKIINIWNHQVVEVYGQIFSNNKKWRGRTS